MTHAIKAAIGYLFGLLVTFFVILVGAEVVLHFFAKEPRVTISVIIALVGTVIVAGAGFYRKKTSV